MAYKDVFDFARSTAKGGTTAEKELFNFLPQERNESVAVAPHDPWEGSSNTTQQDPKIVRETSPQAHVIFNLMQGMTSDIKNSSDNIEVAISDPSSVVGPGAGVMASGQETTDKVKDQTPSPTEDNLPETPKPKDEKPEGFGEQPKKPEQPPTDKPKK